MPYTEDKFTIAALGTDAGGIDQCREHGEAPDDLIDHALAGGGIGHIGLDRERITAGGADDARRLFGALAHAIDAGDLRTFGGQSLRRGGTDAGACARDQGHLALHPGCHDFARRGGYNRALDNARGGRPWISSTRRRRRCTWSKSPTS